MTKKYYLDTCIWVDYWENRKDRFRPLGEWAFQLITMIVKEKGFILFSNTVEMELNKKYSSKEIGSMKLIVPKGQLFWVEERTEQAKEALKLVKAFKIPFEDAVHVILARDNDAVLITRDKHFLELLDYVEVKKPEDLI